MVKDRYMHCGHAKVFSKREIVDSNYCKIQHFYW